MEGYRSEKEQIEMLVDLWKKYGVPLIAGIIIALALSFAWHKWQTHEKSQRVMASATYERYINSQLVSDKMANARKKLYADKLLSDYHKTPYARLTRLMLAHEAVKQQHYPGAIKQLSAVMNDHKASDGLRTIARLRLARVYLAMKQADKSLATLKGDTNKAFKAQHQIILGQIYQQMGRRQQARQALQQALSLLPKNAPVGNVVQMQLDDLA